MQTGLTVFMSPRIEGPRSSHTIQGLQLRLVAAAVYHYLDDEGKPLPYLIIRGNSDYTCAALSRCTRACSCSLKHAPVQWLHVSGQAREACQLEQAAGERVGVAGALALRL